MSAQKQVTYHNLVIVAECRDTEIWLGDDDGHFVQRETGTFSSSLLAGTYTVEFDLGSARYEINLAADCHYAEADLMAREPSPRRILKLRE